jgi:glucose-1-phosphate thymidylyltransferase
VILAGGSGSRLHPLTRITNKHLLPIYDRPMISYGIEALVKAGISDIMLVTGGTHAGEFLRLLGNGQEYGIDKLFYAYQEKQGGVAEALGLAERFVADDRAVVLLADNILERSIKASVERFDKQPSGARILLSQIRTPPTSAISASPRWTSPDGLPGSWRSPRTRPPTLVSPASTATRRRCSR